VSISRVLVVVMIALLAGVPAARHASAPSDSGHVAALKHAPRTPPSSARAADVVRPLDVGPPMRLAERPAPAPPHRVAAVAPSAPFVPPRV
jgi:hypothetical protein